MKKEGYYSSGEFARMSHITLRTVRYYDKKNILKPSLVTENGTRFYTDEDFTKLQQILLLKYLGFSLEDIREMTVNELDYHYMLNSLHIQQKLVRDRIEQMQLVEQAIADTAEAMEAKQTIDWSQMLNLIHLTGMESSLKNQYESASNISARIRLHNMYSQNHEGWFPWIYGKCNLSPGMKILEIGCGDGTLWTMNRAKLPENVSITLTDPSQGMLRDARRAIGTDDTRFHFESCSGEALPYEDGSFDLVIANHVLFYCDEIEKVCSEVNRVLAPGGHFLCSTYGSRHMQEVSQLAQGFNEHIRLSGEQLFERFGRDNGAQVLANFFENPEWIAYEDCLIVTEADPLISYILSCHGNQNQYLLDHYREFRGYVHRSIGDGFRITKDAGIFILQKD